MAPKKAPKKYIVARNFKDETPAGTRGARLSQLIEDLENLKVEVESIKERISALEDAACGPE